MYIFLLAFHTCNTTDVFQLDLQKSLLIWVHKFAGTLPVVYLPKYIELSLNKTPKETLQ